MATARWRCWPADEDELAELQRRLAEAWSGELAGRRFVPPGEPLVAGCFVAYAPGEAGPGAPGDRAWASAVAWRARPAAKPRSADRVLKGITETAQSPRRAVDVEAQAVVADRVPARYAPGLLALREGPIMAATLDALLGRGVRPDVLMVDATGRDHPRRAGLAIHLGAAFDLPSVGVTHRTLVAEGDWPGRARGETSPVWSGTEEVGCWVRTRRSANPVVAHAGWRTDAPTAADVVLAASTDGARTPIPLQEARRVAREARAQAVRR